MYKLFIDPKAEKIILNAVINCYGRSTFVAARGCWDYVYLYFSTSGYPSFRAVERRKVDEDFNLALPYVTPIWLEENSISVPTIWVLSTTVWTYEDDDKALDIMTEHIERLFRKLSQNKKRQIK